MCLHRPLGLTLALTGCCVRARVFASQDVSARILNLLPHFLHRPDGMLRAPLFALQGGGLAIGGLAIGGTATLTNTNVYSNEARYVCLPSSLA